jgi:LuxR family transcriptional regulator, maltose regulon positive regulatory protein
VSTTVLATKLFAPPRRAQLVTRARLTERLDHTLEEGHRLTLLSAPAGFGKTTVLSEWLASLTERQVAASTGWLSLDDGDNDLPRLLSHLVAALTRAGIDVGPAVQDSPGAGTATLTALLNDVVRAGEQAPERHWVLVLDDYHVVGTPAVHEAVGFLLDHLPSRLHLVLATRADPPLPLARLRSRGQLLELRAADLRFTPAEASEFLGEVMGLELTTYDVDALEQRTEGWIAGLQLAALSLRDVDGRDAMTGFIDAFTGSNRFVIDYLADEVLTRQPPDVRDFLLRSSVLDRLRGPLCDAVVDGSGSGRVLERLERGNLFVVPLDSERSWYRYHHLFADVLQARLAAEQPDAVPVLHRRASAWYSTHHLVADAVRHALAAGDHEHAGHLVEEALPEVRRARRDNLLLGWVRSLPGPVVARSPVLSILNGWSLLMAGDLDGTERRLDAAEAALAAGAEHPERARAWADTEDLRTAPATISVYRASLAQARGDVAGTVRHARRALGLAGPDDHLVRGSAGGFLGLAAWAAGDLDEAVTTFSEAVRSLHAAGNLVDELDSTIVLADMFLAAGRPGQARRLYQQALATATGNGQPHPRTTTDLHVGLAELDLELDDLPGAERHLETARVLGERDSITENRHRWYVAMARVRAATGDSVAAAGLLDEAAALYRHGFYPDVRPVAAVRARVHLGAGDLGAAETWAAGQGVDTADEATYLREYDHLTLVRIALARHRRAADDPDAALDDALGLLDRLEAAAPPGRAGSLLEIRVLRALIHHERGDRSAAVDELGRALTGAPEPAAHVRLFLDEGPPMLALLRVASGGDAGEHLRQHARRLVDAATTTVAPEREATTAEAGHPLPDPLSDRELEVLRLLDSDLTGPQIARRLYVSLNTLRTHTKRIFTKLDVNTRAAAVRRGRQVGLLEPPGGPDR